MKEIPVYYQKKVCQLKDCRHGDWVFDDEGRLCFVEIKARCNDKPMYSLHSMCIETGSYEEKEVYPISLTTLAIAKRMEEHRDMYYKGNILCPEFSQELREEFHNLMLVDDTADDSREQYNAIWERMDARLEERLGYAELLHIHKKG